jgi:hypothetical protein
MMLGKPELIWGEFQCFLGILALMAAVLGFKKISGALIVPSISTRTTDRASLIPAC